MRKDMVGNIIIITGKPPALPEDAQSLTFTGLLGSLPSLNRSKFEERETPSERLSEPKPFGVGMQVSHDMDTQVSKETDLYEIAQVSRSCAPGIGGSERKQGGGRSLDAGPCSHVAFDSAEILRGSSDWFYQRQKRHPYRTVVCGATKELYRAALLGQGIFCINRRPGRGGHQGIHPEAGRRGSENRPAKYVRIEVPALAGAKNNPL